MNFSELFRLGGFPVMLICLFAIIAHIASLVGFFAFVFAKPQRAGLNAYIAFALALLTAAILAMGVLSVEWSMAQTFEAVARAPQYRQAELLGLGRQFAKQLSTSAYICVLIPALVTIGNLVRWSQFSPTRSQS